MAKSNFSEKFLEDLEDCLWDSLPKTQVRDRLPQFKQYVAKLEKIAEVLRQTARKSGVSMDEGTYFARLDKKKIDRALRKLDRLRKV